MSSAKDYQRVRNSAEEDEIEMDRLLVQGRSANGQGRNTQTSNGKNAGAQKDENGRLMYDVDEEGRRMSGNSRLSEEMDRAKLNDLSQKRKTVSRETSEVVVEVADTMQCSHWLGGFASGL
jgi:hypothetical protein